MNSINIKKKRIEQNMKVIMLGNGKRIVFKSKRVANAYIADTNRFLTKCLVTLNLAYADLFWEYRIVWFTVTNFGCGPASNARNEMQRCRIICMTILRISIKFPQIPSHPYPRLL